MFIATLLTDPNRPVLDRAAVEALRNAWGGGDALWLDPGVAAEFPLASLPDNRWQVWDSLQAMQIDLVVHPAAGRKKRLLLADMDSTMIRQECIDELADEAGFGPRVAEITRRAMNGELDFEAALRDPLVHVAQHVSFFATALLFWSAMRRAARRSVRRSRAGTFFSAGSSFSMSTGNYW